MRRRDVTQLDTSAATGQRCLTPQILERACQHAIALASDPEVTEEHSAASPSEHDGRATNVVACAERGGSAQRILHPAQIAKVGAHRGVPNAAKPGATKPMI